MLAAQDDTRIIYRMMTRMIKKNNALRKKISASKMTIILVCRMIGPICRMNHPKIVNHPGFIEKPEL